MAGQPDGERPKKLSIWLLPGGRKNGRRKASVPVPDGGVGMESRSPRRLQRAASIRTPTSCREEARHTDLLSAGSQEPRPKSGLLML